MCMCDVFRNFYSSFFLLYQVQYTQYKVVYLAQITYLCKYFYLHITLSLIADEMNELCTGGEILLEEDDDNKLMMVDVMILGYI